MNSPQSLALRFFALLALASVGLTSCSVNSDGPATQGASYGSILGSDDMSDYYYKKDAGWTYTFQNLEQIHNADGSITTLTGAPDYVNTLGFDGFAPNGDSLFRVQITYRVSQAFAGRGKINMWYVTQGNSQNGAFIDGDPTQILGARNMQLLPRPVSCDTILAGVAGRVRTVADDFTNATPSVWQTDTLWFTCTQDSVYIWERFPGQTQLSKSRCIFCRNFKYGISWNYDMTNYDPALRTVFKVLDPDMTAETPYGSFPHTARMAVVTPDHLLNMPITEHKFFACGFGLIKQHDDWFVTTNGLNSTEEEFTRSLVSLTHN